MIFSPAEPPGQARAMVPEIEHGGDLMEDATQQRKERRAEIGSLGAFLFLSHLMLLLLPSARASSQREGVRKT